MIYKKWFFYTINSMYAILVIIYLSKYLISLQHFDLIKCIVDLKSVLYIILFSIGFYYGYTFIIENYFPFIIKLQMNNIDDFEKVMKEEKGIKYLISFQKSLIIFSALEAIELLDKSH